MAYRPRSDEGGHDARYSQRGPYAKAQGKSAIRWGSITDDDYQKAKGDRDQLIGTIKEKTGEAEDAIRRRLDEFERDDG
jgi:uncharacterized protein YjbJ (UPF0337 family)